MKKLLFLGSVILAGATMFTSCKKSTADVDPNAGDSLHITLSRSTIEYNNFDYVAITVKNNAGVDITSSCTILQNNAIAINSKYVPTGLGTYTITAKNGSMPSDAKTLTVTQKSASPFTQKILVEDCTGTWCGYCPRVADALETYKASHPNCIVSAIHGGGGGDPFLFQYYTTFNNHWSFFSGYPTAIINRSREWSEDNSELDQALSAWAPLGLAINSTVNGTTVTGNVKVKFNVTTDKSMKVVIALVENGLVYPQTNYYAPTYGGNPIANFVHNGVLRKTATNLFGDPIAVTAQTKDNILDIPFSMTLSGSTASGTFNAVAGNCGILAYVVDGSAAEKGTYNVQYARLGATQNFD